VSGSEEGKERCDKEAEEGKREGSRGSGIRYSFGENSLPDYSILKVREIFSQ